MSGWWLGSRRKRQADLEEEIRAHLAMAKQDRMDRNETPEQAEENVRREFGNEALIKDVTRHVGVGLIRTGRPRRPLRFGVINSVLLHPMNYPAPNALVELTRRGPGGDSPSVTPLKFDFWRTSNHGFRAMAAYNVLATGVNLTGHGQPERLTCLSVSSDFFRVLGVNPPWAAASAKLSRRIGAG